MLNRLRANDKNHLNMTLSNYFCRNVIVTYLNDNILIALVIGVYIKLACLYIYIYIKRDFLMRLVTTLINFYNTFHPQLYLTYYALPLPLYYSHGFKMIECLIEVHFIKPKHVVWKVGKVLKEKCISRTVFSNICLSCFSQQNTTNSLIIFLPISFMHMLLLNIRLI